VKRSLDELCGELLDSAPADRIALRDPFLAHGSACIPVLVDVARQRPDLLDSVSAWLERLATTQPDARDEAVRALRLLARRPDGEIARSAVGRLAPTPARPARPARPAGQRPPPTGRSAALEAVYQRIIEAARDGRVLTYEELHTNRGHVGTYLHTIALDEAAAGRPPLTALVVSKSTGLPGEGFMPALEEVGYAQPGESLQAAWERAVADVHAYWAEH
jgi:hypothetical protein